MLQEKSYTYDELVKMGAKPSGYSYEELVAAGAKPAETAAPAIKEESKPPEPPGFLDTVKAMIQHDPAGQILLGFGKDVGSTAYEFFKRSQKQNPMTPAIVKMPEEKPSWLKPEGLPQNVGAGLSTVAQFALPSAAAGKIPAVAKAGILGRTAVEAGISSGVGKARGESNEGAARDAAMSGGITALFGAAGKAAGALGERIELALLKPIKADLKGIQSAPEVAPQTMIQNLYKHDLGGTLQQSYQKAAAKTAALGTRLRAALGVNPKADVDVFQVLADTSHELSGSTAQNFGTNTEISKAVNRLLDEISFVSPTGRVNLADAQDMKQALGTIGSWVNGSRDAESTAMETVANAMYTKLRKAIEASSGQSAEIQAINKDFSEIIPIKNAIIRRIPVAGRREIISLKEALALATGNVGGVGLAAADQVLRSGTAANALVNASKNPIRNAASAASVLTGVTATAADRLRSRLNPAP